jgi:hypothetical protein
MKQNIKIITNDGQEFDYLEPKDYTGFKYELVTIAAYGVADILWYGDNKWYSLKEECLDTGEEWDSVWQPSVESFLRDLQDRAWDLERV